MPRYDYQCNGCDQVKEYVMHSDGITIFAPVCECGCKMKRCWTIPVVLERVCDRPENAKGNYLQRKWMETPEVHKKLVSGEYAVDKG